MSLMIRCCITTIVLGLVSLCALAEEFTQSKITYTINDDGETVTITGCSLSTQQSSYTIAETVTYNDVTYTITAIGDAAFTVNKIKKLTLPASLIEIGCSAFCKCTALTSVDMSACTKLETISDSAFYLCTALATLNVSNCSSLKTIGAYAFTQSSTADLTTLTGLEDCTSLESIGERAFYKCANLSLALVMPASLSSIGRAAFYHCEGITSVDLSACTNLTEIESDVFYYCNNNESLQLPASIESIGAGAFGYNKALTELDLSALTKLTYIDDAAFCYCTSVVTIVLPSGLTSFANKATFAGCNALTTVYITNTSAMVEIVESGSDEYSSWGGVFTTTAALEKIYVPKRLRSTYLSDENWVTYEDYIATYVPGSAKGYLEIDGEGSYWGTYACDEAMDAPTDVKYYDVVSINNSEATLVEVTPSTINDENVLPAGAYLISSEESASKLFFFDYTGSDEVTACANSYLFGTSDGGTFSESGCTYYVLTSKSGVVGFYYQSRSKWTGTDIEGQSAGTGVVVEPYKAYLKISNSSSATSTGFTFTFAEEDVTGVESTVAISGDGACYDLQGRKVCKPERGRLYIKDGRKYIAE